MKFNLKKEDAVKIFNSIFEFRGKTLLDDAGKNVVASTYYWMRKLSRGGYNYYDKIYNGLPSSATKQEWVNLEKNIDSRILDPNRISLDLVVPLSLFDDLFNALTSIQFDLDTPADTNSLIKMLSSGDYDAKDLKSLLSVDDQKMGKIVSDFISRKDFSNSIEHKNFNSWIASDIYCLDSYLKYLSAKKILLGEKSSDVLLFIKDSFGTSLNYVNSLKVLCRNFYDYLDAIGAKEEDYWNAFALLKEWISDFQKFKVLQTLEGLMLARGFDEAKETVSLKSESPIGVSNLWSANELCKNYSLNKEIFCKKFNFGESVLSELQRKFVSAAHDFGNDFLCKNVECFKNSSFSKLIWTSNGSASAGKIHKLQFTYIEGDNEAEQLNYLAMLMNALFNKVGNLDRKYIEGIDWSKYLLDAYETRDSYLKMVNLNAIMDKVENTEVEFEDTTEFKL